MFQNAKIAETEFRQYASGVKDGMGLDGEYQLDPQAWEFRPVLKEKEEVS